MSHLRKPVVGIVAAASLMLSAHGWSESLPANLTWISNMDQPVFANQEAPKGGTVNYRISSFPLTLRTEGPDSNGAFAAWTRGLFGSLMERHPNTREFIPYLAESWAFAGDDRTMYFKLDEDARWSDGEKVTADDFVFTREFMTSEDIQAPWYNDYYSNEISEVTKIDEYTLKVVSGPAKPVDELYEQVNLRPLPEHAIRPALNEDWVEEQNWTIFPTVAAYQIDDVDMGKSITLKRVKDWWAADKKYMVGRYNVDKFRIKVIRDTDVTLQALNKGELDAHMMIFPAQWHSFNEDFSAYAKGYIQKTWAFNATPQGLAGVWLNKQDPMLSNHDIRLGIAHAMNVPKMLEAALYGDYQHLQNLGSGYGKYENKDVKAFPFNPDKAREYFAKAGYSKMGPNGFLVNDAGEELKVELLYLSPAHTPRTSVLQEEAKKAGLNLELNLLAGAQGFKAMLEKNHKAGFVGMGAGMLPAYWQYFHSDNAKEQTNNFTMTADPELDKLIMTYKEEFDTDVRIKAAHAIQEWVIADAAYIPTYSVPFTRAAHWKWLKVPAEAAGLEDSLFCSGGLSDCYGRFWVDAEEKKAVEAAMKSGKTFESVTRIDTTWK
ncbi:extracellular solute-binding protein [Reinekea marina]|uniref:Extracellular solute-binding protein n=1 Tax=Reinekea marina TaxID=1310421 RepID=A0ABV7WUY9_9GAMM|nr:extracellular solute-binding protein [Reinekea marina]MBU2862737.1 extracellular solute-binding protein [Reinekea forsetii]MDN3648981.1 extracellular solute-binding protein [Reinekea marina]